MFGFLKSFFGGGSSVLTREEIGTLPPKKLYFRVLYSLPDAEEANDAQRDFVSMVMLDGEVRNGGFNQYYYNMGAEPSRRLAGPEPRTWRRSSGRLTTVMTPAGSGLRSCGTGR